MSTSLRKTNENMNIWAVLVAAASSFLLGGFWYSKSFLGGLWNREAGRTAKIAEGHHPAKAFGLRFCSSVIAGAAFAWWFGPNPPLEMAFFERIDCGPVSRRGSLRNQLSIRLPKHPAMAHRWGHAQWLVGSLQTVSQVCLCAGPGGTEISETQKKLSS